jgi:hypothetical protein
MLKIDSKPGLAIYDGSTDVLEFIRQFKILAALHDWNDAKQLANIELFLKAKPLRIYKTAQPTSTTLTTIAPMFKALIDGCAHSSAYLHGLFRSRRKLPNETYGQFAAALYDLLKGAMPTIQDDQLLGALKAQFSEGVTEQVRVLIHFDKDKTWDNLVESLDQMYPGANQVSSNASALIDQFKIEPVESNLMYGKSRPTLPTTNNTNRFNGNCHYCHNYGHRISECIKLAEANNSQHGAVNNRSFNSSASSNRYSQGQYRNQSGSNNSNIPTNGYNNRCSNQSLINQSSTHSHNDRSYSNPSRIRVNNDSINSSQASNMNTSCISNNPLSNSTFDDNAFLSHSNDLNSDSDVLNSHNHFIMIDSHNQSYQEFPNYDSNFDSESYALDTISIQSSDDFLSQDAVWYNDSWSMTVHAQIKCTDNDHKDDVTVHALVDCGSSDSFVDSSLFSPELLLELEDNIDCHRTLNLATAISFSELDCYLLTCNLIISGWSRCVPLLVTKLNSPHKMILGIDFLKREKVKLDFASCSMCIDDSIIVMDMFEPGMKLGEPLVQSLHFNVIESTFQKASYSMPTKGTLLKTIARFKASLPNIQFSKMATALIDSGSTHSFLSPKMLSANFLNALATDDSRRMKFSITSATGIVEEDCFIVTLNLMLDDWSGPCQFVVSHKAAKHDMVLGIDFLRRESVKIDHGCDSIHVGNIAIKVFSTTVERFKTVRFAGDTVFNDSNNLAKCQSNITVKSNTQRLIPVFCCSCRILTRDMFFEPVKDGPSGCLLGKSVHAKIDYVYVSILNASDHDVNIAEGSVLGEFHNCIVNHESSQLNKPSTSSSIIDVNYLQSQSFKPLETQVAVNGCPVYSVTRLHLKPGEPSEIMGKSESFVVDGKLLLFKALGNTPYLIRDTLLAKSDTFLLKIESTSDAECIINNGTLLGHVRCCSDDEAFEMDIDNNTVVISKMEQDRRLNEVIEKIKLGPKLSELNRAEVLAILVENYHLFQWNDGPPGCTPFAMHSIPTGDSLPIVQRQYPIPTVAQDALRSQVADMLRTNIIRPASGPWRSPVLLIAKMDPETKIIGYRFCIDLRKINNATVKDAYSLPRIDESVDVLAGAKYLSSMDINRAFWQVPLKEADKEKTGFMVEGKLFEFNVMPFGSMNAPATFQRLMDRVLSGMTWKQVLVYLDDVLIFSKD